MKRLLATGMAVLFLASCGREEKKEVIVSAAASLEEGIKEIAQDYQRDTGIEVSINLGGSGSLKKQVEEGAPVDVILLASKAYYDELDRRGYIDEGGYLLENTLTVVGEKGIENLNQLKGTIAIGDPGFVPAGRYAREALVKAGTWEKVEEDLLLTKDVRSALAYANMGEVDYSVVYKTDSLLGKELQVYEIPEDLYSEIVYSGGALKDASQEGEEFYTYLLTKLKVFEKYGFKVRKNVN
jgi:molybdate transport system substrate-binding protein